MAALTATRRRGSAGKPGQTTQPSFSARFPLQLNSSNSVHQSKKDVRSRIISGFYAQPDQFPFQAALSSEGDGFATCGGALVHPHWVLTAGHCLLGKWRMQVTLGVTDYALNEPGKLQQWSHQLVMHPQYAPRTETMEAHDIGMIYLPKAPNLSNNRHIQTIPLPMDEWADLRGGLKGTLAGWGMRASDNPSFDPRLKFANMDTVDPEHCRRSWPPGYVTNSHLCLPGFQKGVSAPCFGDSGSPFVAAGQVYGVVSFGPQKCEDGTPFLLTHVGSYRQWITDTYLGPPPPLAQQPVV